MVWYGVVRMGEEVRESCEGYLIWGIINNIESLSFRCRERENEAKGEEV